VLLNRSKARNISRKGAKTAKEEFCHFDRREKSFLDLSHSLGMTGLARHVAFLASWRESLRFLLSFTSAR
jgi:hypothetical protein